MLYMTYKDGRNPPKEEKKKNNWMKTLGSVIILGFFWFCSQERTKTIKKVEIKKVDFELTSIVSISCNDFERSFQKEIETIAITDAKRIDSFSKIVDGLRQDQENYTPDVRAKILVHYLDGKMDTICLSDIGILLNGKSFLGDESLVTFISDLKK